MKIPMAEIIRGNWWKKGWWRPGKYMGPVSERKAHVRLISECQYQTENSVVRGNTLHHTDGHGPRGIQGEIAEAGTGRGLSM
jgi:hypothetical protein